MRLHALTRSLSLTLMVLALTTAGLHGEGRPGGPPLLKRLKFRSIGPAAGGRVARACGVPGDPLTWYAATAAGGVWKSADGGFTWKPIFDDQPVATIGAIAVAPSDPNVLYVGTGEANIRGNVQVGNGIYKSVDAGKTWKHVWKQEGQIGTLIVHPTKPHVAYAAVLGKAFGPNDERGVYRTTDGGQTWKRVLFKDRDTGASDVCFDPSNPYVLLAGLWQARRTPWSLTSGGPGSGLYLSRDGGDTWSHLVPPPTASGEAPAGTTYCPGLPAGIWGKIGVAVAPSDGRRVYALIEAEKGGLFRSDDGGATWKHVNPARALRQRAWYYSTLTVDPRNADVVWFPQVPLLKSIDGGKTLQRVKGPHHGDHHDVWIDPKDPRRLIDSNDGGVDLSFNGGETWYAPRLPISQFYHIAVDNRVPYHISGTMQDIGTASGPSNSLSEHGIPISAWHTVGGGEAGYTAPDPADPRILYAGEYGGYITRYDDRTRQAHSIGVYPFNPSGHGAEALKYRFQWTAPILVSPHDHRVVYHAANVLFRTTDAGLHWQLLSPDLTRNDRSKQKWSGGPITGDNTGVEVYGTIFALAESPRQPGLLWTGSDDGLVYVSKNGGKDWTNVTANLKGLPAWGTVCCIEPSPFDADTAYVVIDNHRQGDNRPYLFRTRDGGKTWARLGDDLPQDVHLRVVRADPVRQGLLYLGTERGLLFSRDDGARWQPLKLNLPTVAVSDLAVKHDDLVVGTSGRSIWILDDLTALREMPADLAARDLFLFPVRPAIRYRYHATIEERGRRGSGENPPKGAIIHYHLKKTPKGEITLEVRDARGQHVATLSSKKETIPPAPPGDYAGEKYKKTVLPREPGLQRVVWDLRHDGAVVIPGAPIDAGEPRQGPLVLPGTYTLRLTVAGQTLSESVEVLPDFRTIPLEQLARAEKAVGLGRPLRELIRAVGAYAFEKELQEQIALTLKVRDDVSRLVHVIEQIRLVRGQVTARNKLLESDARAAELVKASKDLLAKLDELEAKLHNPKAEVTYDILAQKGGARLYSQLAWLFEMLKESDGRPTQGVREVHADQHRLLERCAAEWEELRRGALERLNQLARRLELPGVVLPEPHPAAPPTTEQRRPSR